MMTRTINIADPGGSKRLRRVARQCVNYGVRVQNSVFECNVDAARYTKLKHLLPEEIGETKDSLRFYSLGNRFAGRVEHFGKQNGLCVEEPIIL